MWRGNRAVWLLACVPFVVAADAAKPAGATAPKSPKATDAIKKADGLIRKAATAYWQACAVADQRLSNELKTAAGAAHDRNDGTEEQACKDAKADVDARYSAETMAVGLISPARPIPPLRCQSPSK